MIMVNCAIMQDKIIQLVTQISDPKFEFVKKEGIKMFFQCSDPDTNRAVQVAKKAIKSDPIGKTLLVSIKPEGAY